MRHLSHSGRSVRSSGDGVAVREYTRVGDLFADSPDIENIAVDFKRVPGRVTNPARQESLVEAAENGATAGRGYFIRGSPCNISAEHRTLPLPV